MKRRVFLRSNYIFLCNSFVLLDFKSIPINFNKIDSSNDSANKQVEQLENRNHKNSLWNKIVAVLAVAFSGFGIWIISNIFSNKKDSASKNGNKKKSLKFR